jgi:hypothetical protein
MTEAEKFDVEMRKLLSVSHEEIKRRACGADGTDPIFGGRPVTKRDVGTSRLSRYSPDIPSHIPVPVFSPVFSHGT